jgi:hypothetical protein
MAPSANLREQLEIAAQADQMSEAEQLDAFNRLVDLVSGLDGWISSGGFLPARWQPKAR